MMKRYCETGNYKYLVCLIRTSSLCAYIVLQKTRTQRLQSQFGIKFYCVLHSLPYSTEIQILRCYCKQLYKCLLFSQGIKLFQKETVLFKLIVSAIAGCPIPAECLETSSKRFGSMCNGDCKESIYGTCSYRFSFFTQFGLASAAVIQCLASLAAPSRLNLEVYFICDLNLGGKIANNALFGL